MMNGGNGGSASRQLVVNADDLGLSESINRGIFEARERGIVTSASLLANSDAFDDAIRRARAIPALDIGVHLNIYRGVPLLPRERVPTLVDGDGRFFGSAGRIAWGLTTRRIDVREVEAEFRAQIEKVEVAGVSPSHLDGDKHLHLWPSVFKKVCALADEYGIRRVRLVRERLQLRWIPVGLTMLSRWDVPSARRRGLMVPDGTIGVGEAPVDIDTLSRLLSAAKGERVEFVVHPGYVDQEFRDLQGSVSNKLVCSREEELSVLEDPQARTLTERSGFVLRNQACDR